VKLHGKHPANRSTLLAVPLLHPRALVCPPQSALLLLCSHDSLLSTIHSYHDTVIASLCGPNVPIELANANSPKLKLQLPTSHHDTPGFPHLNSITMFARRLVKSSSSLSAPSNVIRTLASTSALCRTPALADITPEGVKSFDAKQKEFRERIAEQSKKKEPSQSELSSNSPLHVPLAWSSTPTAPPASTARSPSSNSQSGQALGSHKGSSSAETAQEDETGKKGKLSSLIYGTKEGREMDREIEHSFSQVLARGKYVHSIVFHEVKPDKVDEYVELVGRWYPRMAGMPENKVHLVGSWRTEVGDCDTFGEFLHPLSLLLCEANTCSPYLGIPALPWLPRLSPLHRQPPRIPCLR
jgi:hypothetical protein